METPLCYHLFMVTLKPLECGITEAIEQCVAALLQGDIVAFPTETFYGLGVRYDRHASLERLYAIKQRPFDKAMPLIIGKKAFLNLVVADVPPAAERLMDRFWPGPLTLILPAKAGLSRYLTAGTGTVAVRIPGSSFAQDLAAAIEFPITATSANISAHPPADSAEDVYRYFDARVDITVDGGRTPGGSPSTLVDVTGELPAIVRTGVIPEEDILRAVQT
ncbi:MAG TPA: L-threonylcarbamoyladenylate synthase [Thermodesulfovibrionales bacterium]|nr:L-threonylcarbamoyladenylate synthase [Thermodesulfovibrionales bacterium]